MATRVLVAGGVLLAATLAGGAAPEHVVREADGMALVGPGIYRPVYPPTPEEKEIPVRAFRLDVRPATNADWLAFVDANPKWAKGSVSRLLADQGYLADWAAPRDPGSGAALDGPVVHVSWHAARAFCAWRGKRLPTTDEWEFAAAASEKRPDGREDPEFTRRILAWYSNPGSAPLRRAGSGPANWWGVRDLHGLAWEWVEDFNSALVSGDNREQGGADALLFCGSGSLRADAKDDYAAFMRIAFRSSLQADYTIGTLGCRCARDAEPKEETP
jgi:formylglycine-generating enzyme required for sulfatase activity